MARTNEAGAGDYRQFRELTRLFFGRFVENDLITLEGDTRAALAGIFALLAAPGLFLPFFEFVHFSSAPLCFMPQAARDLVAIGDKVLHIGLAMTVLGIISVIEWDAMLPDLRDSAVLRPLPIRLGMLFSAKVAALAGFFILFTATLSGLSSVLFPMAVATDSSAGMLARYILAHAITVLAANAFIFLAMLAVQGVLMGVLGWSRYRRWAPYAQSLLIAGLIILFFVSLASALRIHPSRPLPAVAQWLPPVWFLGLYQQIVGYSAPVFDLLAGRALSALVLASAVAGCSYLLSYRRSVAGAMESADVVMAPPARLKNAAWAWFDRLALSGAAERASFHFVRDTVMRSRSHRVMVASFAGVGLAVVFQGLAGIIAAGNKSFWQSPTGPLMPAALILPVFLLTGLRYAYTVPAELRANWVFQVSGHMEPRELMSGVRKATAALGLIPVLALLLPVHGLLWSWRAAALHVTYAGVVGWLLMETLLVGLGKLPFTCSYVPGKANLKASWPLYLGGYLLYVGVFSALELLIVAVPGLFWAFAAGAAAWLVLLEYQRRREFAGEYRLEFNERAAPAVQTLGLYE
jgi:hypothetical protein